MCLLGGGRCYFPSVTFLNYPLVCRVREKATQDGYNMAHFVLFINSLNKYILKYAITGLGTEAFVVGEKKKKERKK